MSTHVTLPPLARISADRVLARFRSQWHHKERPPGTKPAPKKKVGPKQRRTNALRKKQGLPEICRKKRGGGGCWRLFVSRSLRARRGRRRANLQQIAIEYRALTAEKKQELAEEAAAGTARHKEGLPTFGKREREIQADIQRDIKRRRGEALVSGAIVPVAHAGPDMKLVDLPKMIEGLESDARAARAAIRDDEHNTAVAIKEWRRGEGVRVRDHLVVAIPSLARHVPEFTGEARVGNAALISWAYPCEDAVPRTLGTLEVERPDFLPALVENWNDTLHAMIEHNKWHNN